MILAMLIRILSSMADSVILPDDDPEDVYLDAFR
jgi:hypothetical protein